MHHPDICIAGAGIIGLSLALELHHRGASVTILDQGAPLAQASTAAAGMLAASDPDNPPELRTLADLSLTLYPNYIERLRILSHLRVPFHTNTTLQALPPHRTASDTLTSSELAHLIPHLVPGDHRFILLKEHSLDPRELATALLAAVHATTIDLRPNTAVFSAHSLNESIEVHTATGTILAKQLVDCTGAWSNTLSPLPHLRLTPKKGQILAISLPRTCPLHFVIRTPEIYIVPRTNQPDSTRAIIGATIEDAGFDKTVHPADISHLHDLAAALFPAIADVPELETWAGLRPATPDGLPLLGPIPGRPRHFIAAGHYRNGILLAPATAHLMAQLLTDEQPSIDLTPFSPARISITP